MTCQFLNQQRLLDDLIAGERHVTGQPGFHASAYLRSHDGTRVVNYSQWNSEQDHNNALREAMPTIRQGMHYGEGAASGVSRPDARHYAVDWTAGGDHDPTPLRSTR